jgi:hypothetical protein
MGDDVLKSVWREGGEMSFWEQNVVGTSLSRLSVL